MVQISTAGAYSAILANLTTAQNQVATAVAQTSSGKKASDLQGYAASSETLTALQAVQTKVSGYLSDSQNTAAKLNLQDLALTQLSGDATSAAQAVSNALASGSAVSLMQSLQSAFSDATGQLNTQYDGQYLFAGGQTNTKPVAATQLSDLTAAPSIASLFNNDQNQPVTRLDDSTTVKTGFLADQLGTPLFSVLQSIQAYAQGPNGPLTGTLTAAQQTFLQGQLATLQAAGTGLTAATAQNGALQNQVTAVQTNLTAQQTTLKTLFGDTADADMAQVAVNLQQAQLAMQASAQVFQVLKSSSLASLLPVA
jgi:flagellar hook-associated protein 3 FlgL